MQFVMLVAIGMILTALTGCGAHSKPSKNDCARCQEQLHIPEKAFKSRGV